ncbi:MAG: porin family protein [Deltaproteobacteria bacterium]|nr:porin family protein [Deltaproteobacteria bacterium]
MMLVAVTSHVAEAGGYLGLGVGTAPSVNDERLTPSSRTFKVLGGQRWTNFTLEGGFGGFLLSERKDIDVYSLQVAAKLNFPLASNIEAFGRAGVQHAWLNTPNPLRDQDGSGYLIGAGFEYRVNLAAGSGSIFVDYTYATANMSNERREKFDLSTRTWMLGITVGI